MSKQLESFSGLTQSSTALVVLGLLVLGHLRAANAQTFLDVPQSHWAYDFIEEMAELGITSGCGNGNYCPEDTVTRAQMAVFIVRAARRPRVVDGNGDIIGDLITTESGDSAGFVNLMTKEGYLIGRLYAPTGELRNVWVMFSGPDCTGVPYVDAIPGSVYGVPGAYYYVPRDTLPVTDFSSASLLSGNGCSNSVFGRPYAWPAIPNDPLVTGVPNEPYVLPIRVELR